MIKLEDIYKEVKGVQTSYVDEENAGRIKQICESTNKGPIRFLLSSCLAKIEDNSIDLHKPYAHLGKHCYNGRDYDERVVEPFVLKYNLPCNSTTAFLSPAFRTTSKALTKASFAKCRPQALYNCLMDVVDCLQANSTLAEDVIKETIRRLCLIQAQEQNRLAELQIGITQGEDAQILSVESITKLLIYHLNCSKSSRLPVLMVAAAYSAVSNLTKETYKPLYRHNAADSQTGSMGDLEIVLEDDDKIVTCYEMKAKLITKEDVYKCVKKIQSSTNRIDNYLFVTTDKINVDVKEFANSFYNQLGVEIGILDCIGFLNHFLHFFYRYRSKFLDEYQRLVLSEPSSAVPQALKEAFLNMRRLYEGEINR